MSSFFYGVLLKDLAEGRTVMDNAKANGKRYSQVRCLKERLETHLLEFLGPNAVADSAKIPLWWAGIHAEQEKVACRH